MVIFRERPGLCVLLCLAASGEPAKCRRRSERPGASQREDAKVSHDDVAAAVVDDVREQDTAAVATGSTAWATTHNKLHDSAITAADTTVFSLSTVHRFNYESLSGFVVVKFTIMYCGRA